MEHSRFSKSMLIADLFICCIWLIFIMHNSMGTVWCRPAVWAAPLLRIWLSFLTYRRSRMALAPIIMLSLLTLGSLLGRAMSGFALFVQPLLLMLQVVPQLFGESVITADNMQEVWSAMSDNTALIGIVVSVWLILLPLGIYIYRSFRKETVPSSFSVRKRVGLYAFLVGTFLVETFVVTDFRYVHIAILLFIPVIFNGGKLEGLITEGEKVFLIFLLLLEVACICALDYSLASVIMVMVFPAAFYTMGCRIAGKDIVYCDVLMIISASVLFIWGQYEINMYRLVLLLLSLALTAIVMMRFAISTRKYWTAAAVYVMVAVILPILSIGYNPYSVLEAGRVMHYDDYRYSPNGLMMVKGKDGYGIRDRYGLILPAEYDWIEHLIPSKPYCKVKKDGHWLIYDIERQELLSEEQFTDVMQCGELAYKLQSPSGDRYLLVPDRYSRFNDDCVAEIVDQLPSERKDSRIMGRWW
ncbi:MAG: hypothetical protein E7116_09185 [Bacteroidales bacterium]|nr:hypothetical protein [Bacteroidales bacterium]